MFSGISFTKDQAALFENTVFYSPAHEPRYGYATTRCASALGSAPQQVEVVAVTHLPSGYTNKPVETVASAEFLYEMERNAFAVSNCVGKLVSASYGRQGRLNLSAYGIAPAHQWREHRPYGSFYWVSTGAVRQTWWRTSIRLDFERMPLVKRKGEGGKLQDRMRLAVKKQIDTTGTDFGPFFVETVWNTADRNRYWFDIYAPTQNALALIPLIF